MAFIGYPSAFLFPEPEPMSNRKSLEHWPWGYYLRTLGEQRNGFTKVRYRWTDDDGVAHSEAWIASDDLQAERLLEINFVDVGQGDGCFVVLPDDTRLLIDAGEGDHMHRFLRWRFNHKPVHIDDLVISHPDKDHYYGLRGLAKDERFGFGNVYHNGLVERSGGPSLGARTPGHGSMLTEIVETPEELDEILDDPAKVGRRLYPNLLQDLRDSGRSGPIWMLHSEDGHMPGFEADDPVSIEVLGPLPERADDGSLRMPWFGSVGKTKNGHSIVLRLTYGGFSALLGGDLNIPAEEYLLEAYTGLSPEPETIEQREELIQAARAYLGCDLMKACHHGSADFTELFIEAVDPLATVISSGDGESHAHPRPDALGALGKYSRGRRPCLFSTELARSHKEFVKLSDELQAEILAQAELLESSATTSAEKRAAKAELERLTSQRERAVAVYGMITARTDGSRLIVTQKLEEKRSSTGEKWDIHRFEPDASGRLRYLAKH